MSNKFDSLPHELRQHPNWVLWRYELVDGKPTKVPYSPQNCGKASVTNPTTWGSLNQCLDALSTSGMSGIGFVMTAEVGYTCIDLDDPYEVDSKGIPKYKNPKEIQTRQIAIAEAFDSYSEVSPSGKGLHIWIKATLPSGRRGAAIEIYPSGRYMTITGDVHNSSPIKNYQELATQLWQELAPNTPSPNVSYETKEATQSDNEILTIAGDAENGMKFRDLYMGEWQRHGYPSQSEADQALINIIAFYTQDPEQIKRIFRCSALGQRRKAFRDDYFDSPTWGMIPKSFDRQPPSVNLDALKQNMALHLAELQIKNRVPVIEGKVLPDLPNPQKDTYSAPPGLIGELAAFIYAAAPRPVPEIALAGAIGLMSGICGRSYNISGTGLNQYTFLLAKTGRGKEAMNKGISKLIASILPSVKDATTFIGPSKIASQPALLKYLSNNSKCFLSIMGEFADTLKKMLNDSHNPSQQDVKETMLDLYNKSGKGDMLGSLIYSDKDKNTKPLTAPSFSLLGEATPEKFYSALSEDMISEGLLSRFNIIEYLGVRPPLNENHLRAEIPPRLIEMLGAIAAYAHNLNNSDNVINIEISDEAKTRLSEFDKFCDDQINNTKNMISEVSAELWNRGHMKALKLSGLLSVGVNYINPCVGLEQAEWAIKLIESNIESLLKRFEDGDVGAPQNQNRQVEDLKKGFARYLKESWDKVKGYPGSTEASYKHKVVPHSFLTAFCRSRLSFKQDRIGPVQALKTLLLSLLESGEIQELAVKDKDKAGIGKNGKVYVVINPKAFL